MIKIVYIISSLKKNGPNRVLKSMIDGIDKSKYEISIISFLNCNDNKYVNSLKNNGIKIFEIDLKKKIEILLCGKQKVNEIIKYIKPHIIHSHGILPDFVNSKINDEKIIKITTLHDNMFEDYVYCFGKLKGIIFIKWHLRCLKKLNMCVCCSKSSYDVLKQHLKNISYVRNSIYNKKINLEEYENNRLRIRNKYGIGKNDIVYIYAGSLSKLKNVEQMITEFNKHLSMNEYLLILGDGKERKKLESDVNNNRIIFCGFIKNVEQYFCASDIYCSFSSSEGFSISVLEAIQNYNLLLLSNISSHKEILKIDTNIYLGETFNKSNFHLKKEKLSKFILINKYDKYNDFLNDEISIYKMMEKYCQIYVNFINGR